VPVEDFEGDNDEEMDKAKIIIASQIEVESEY
jgi:hypothetical protein